MHEKEFRLSTVKLVKYYLFLRLKLLKVYTVNYWPLGVMLVSRILYTNDVHVERMNPS